MKSRNVEKANSGNVKIKRISEKEQSEKGKLQKGAILKRKIVKLTLRKGKDVNKDKSEQERVKL